MSFFSFYKWTIAGVRGHTRYKLLCICEFTIFNTQWVAGTCVGSDLGEVATIVLLTTTALLITLRYNSVTGGRRTTTLLHTSTSSSYGGVPPSKFFHRDIRSPGTTISGGVGTSRGTNVSIGGRLATLFASLCNLIKSILSKGSISANRLRIEFGGVFSKLFGLSTSAMGASPATSNILGGSNFITSTTRIL